MVASNKMLLMLTLAVVAVSGLETELTFDMPPHEIQCFYEEVEEVGTDITVGWEVVFGGRLDVDIEIKIGQRVIHHAQRSQTDEYSFEADTVGEYSFCFSNQFSTVAHKTVYIDILVGGEEPILAGMKDQKTALTQVESSLVTIHENLKKATDYQTHHRNRETSHRHSADFINNRVQWVSASEALALVVISLFQVYYLRSLFNEK